MQNKAASLKETHNPLAVDCEENGPEQLDAREREAMDYVIADSLNGLKRILCETVESWNSRQVIPRVSLAKFMFAQKHHICG